ncbi:alkanesulfonate monooxygenase SsuD/methylene tetrahydromethanopterin reductase-like flavin-dependent oxidoreductase (luciferase family) [Kitasatospora sp. GP30]|nr:alkanesulfonate monooxygenase SsuD/methylene tetrahydromethanopterin reductase-like flavin-dependent oxidoreductase (luciferase family) [Kitasatospora sp. GP30]
MVMSDAARTEWWESLPAGIREQIDGYVLQDSVMGAVRLVFNVGRASHGIGLNTAQAIVADRYEHYGDRIARTPDSPLDLDSLAYRAAGFPGRILAIEAIWDGDTVHDWFVELLAVTEDPETDHHLATVYYSTAKNHLAAQHTSDPRPLPAIAADRAGRALAAHLAVPFHFASPDTPDDEAPHWRP